MRSTGSTVSGQNSEDGRVADEVCGAGVDLEGEVLTRGAHEDGEGVHTARVDEIATGVLAIGHSRLVGRAREKLERQHDAAISAGAFSADGLLSGLAFPYTRGRSGVCMHEGVGGGEEERETGLGKRASGG